MSLTDESGNFLFTISPALRNDTLLISSVGYESLRIPVSEALRRNSFELVERSMNLSPVTIRSFSTEAAVGTTKESVGYFRSWNYDTTGGELGRIFDLTYDSFKLEKVRFKVSNLCNACLLRLHIRNVVNGWPGEELLRDSIPLSIHRNTLDDKALEFNLTNYNLVFTQKELFVGIEVHHCFHPGVPECSFCFASTEPGFSFYKPRGDSKWESSEDFSPYLRLIRKY
ncbi:MAG: hypothetical protein IPI66_14590 [Chitinophagaceae bacterium]|nr:hypothetical protein [Chitinophagaceae bacterium]